MQKQLVLVLLILFSTNLHAADEIIGYFDVDGVSVDNIYSSQSKDINDEYKVVVAYATNSKRSWKHDVVGAFLVSKKGVEILDIFPSEGQLDFLPSIKTLSSTELIVSVNSDYGELKKIKYILNLKAKIKLISRVELTPRGIPDDLP